MDRKGYNNRKEVRIPENLEVTLFSPYNSPGEGLAGKVTDISRNGLYIALPHNIKKDALLKVRLKLPEETEPVEFLCRVTRETDGGLGTKIEVISEEEQKRLNEFFHLSHLYGWFC